MRGRDRPRCRAGPLAAAGLHPRRGWVGDRLRRARAVRHDARDASCRQGESVTFEGASGYHDHNWGFWQGVSWQWGQVAHEDLSVVYGRVFPPADVADPARVPGFLTVLGPDGPLGFSTNVTIDDSTAGVVDVRATRHDTRSAAGAGRQRDRPHGDGYDGTRCRRAAEFLPARRPFRRHGNRRGPSGRFLGPWIRGDVQAERHPRNDVEIDPAPCPSAGP